MEPWLVFSACKWNAVESVAHPYVGLFIWNQLYQLSWKCNCKSDCLEERCRQKQDRQQQLKWKFIFKQDGPSGSIFLVTVVLLLDTINLHCMSHQWPQCVFLCACVWRGGQLSYVELKPSGFFLITENRNTSTRHQTHATASNPVVMAVKRRMAKKYFFEQVRYLCSWLPPNSWFCYLVITLRVPGRSVAHAQ